jgi:GNAT superfamily N-acetyltransferase
VIRGPHRAGVAAMLNSQAMNASSARFELRPACPEDIPCLLELIRGLADYEHLAHLYENTPERLATSLFGHTPAAHALLAWTNDADRPLAAGFALYFYNYSTFLGRKGLYLEDIYVRPEYRGRGIGRALIVTLARIALREGCGRFEWSVLDWNTPAQRFYEGLGATVLPDWRIVRTTGHALDALAAQRAEGAL